MASAQPAGNAAGAFAEALDALMLEQGGLQVAAVIDTGTPSRIAEVALAPADALALLTHEAENKLSAGLALSSAVHEKIAALAGHNGEMPAACAILDRRRAALEPCHRGVARTVRADARASDRRNAR